MNTVKLLLWGIGCLWGVSICIILGGLVFPPLFLLAIMLFVASVILLIIYATRKDKKEARAEWLEKQREKQAEAEEKQKELKIYAEKLRKAEAENKRPVSAVVICTEEIRGAGALNTATRGLFGYALLGVFGAGVGIATARSKTRAQKVTFSVRYASGRTGTETVDSRSKRFQELSAVVVVKG